MIDDTGIFRTTIAVSSLTRLHQREELADVKVDAGSAYSWIPSSVLETLGIEVERMELFETADGRVLERDIGFAILYAGQRSTPAIVVFAAPSDTVVLGALGLEGMNLRVDVGRKELVPAGPVPAAATNALFPPPQLHLELR